MQTLKCFSYLICSFHSYGYSRYHIIIMLIKVFPTSILQTYFPVLITKQVSCVHLSLCITLFLLWASPLKCVPYHQIPLNHHLVLLSTFLSFHLCSKPILHSHKFCIWIAPNLPNWFFFIHLRLEVTSMLFQGQIHSLHAEDEFCPFHIMVSFPTKLMGTMLLVLTHKNSNLHLCLYVAFFMNQICPKLKHCPLSLLLSSSHLALIATSY